MSGEAPAAPPRPKRVWLLAALLLAAGLLYYSVRGIDWRQVGRVIAGASPALLAATCALATATLALRAWRWRLLLTAEAPVGFADAFWATAAGYFGNNFLPARGGELVRTFMISARTGLRNAYVLATAISERIVDAITLVVISAVVLLVFPAQSGWLAGAARPFAIAGALGGLAIAILPLTGSLARRLVMRAPLPDRLRPRLIAAIEGGLRGVSAFHDARRLASFIALTIVIWCGDTAGAVVGADALGFRLPVPVAFLLLAGLGLASALPSTPGYVGIYQFVAVMVLLPFGFSRTDAIAFILVAQALGYVVIGIWGAIGLVRYRRARRSA